MSVRFVTSTSSIVTEVATLKPPLHSSQRGPTDDNDIYCRNRTMNPILEQRNSPTTHIEYADDDDFMMRFVDGTCRGIFPTDDGDDSEKRSLCHLPTCHLGEGLDVLLHCRQPLSFFSFFHEIHSDEGIDVHLLPAGAYLLPRQCEYCGQSDTSLCNPKRCTRPPLYLQKKRPPFGKPNSSQWDPFNDHFIPLPLPPPPVSSPSRSSGSWVSDFFRGTGSDSDQRR